LHLSDANEFVPDKAIFRKMLNLDPSDLDVSHNEMIFISGLPTSVCKRIEDDRDMNNIGLKVSDNILKSYAREAMIETKRSEFQIDILGWKKGVIAKIEVEGLSELLPSSFGVMGSLHPSEYSKRQRREGLNWHFRKSHEIVGLTDAIKQVIKKIPALKNWMNVISFDYYPLFGNDRIRKRGKNRLTGIIIKVMQSLWCPIKRGNHSGRKGNAKVLMMRGSGFVKISCFTSHCGDRVMKNALKDSIKLAEMFKLLEHVVK